MTHFRLYELTDVEFQDLVVLICRELLGPGVTAFAPGKDGGKDAKFDGTATMFPSPVQPATGKFIIQAKHTTNPHGSCSDYDFEKTEIGKEVPKIKKQFEAGTLTHYIVFTNRRKTGGAEDRIPVRVTQDTGVKDVWLRGLEDVERELLLRPNIVKAFGLEKRRPPIQFVPEDLRDVITAFHSHCPSFASAFDSSRDFRDYPGLPAKNIANNLSTPYLDYIFENSEPLFPDIRRFLTNQRNRPYADQYHAVADELKGQLITHRSEFTTFDAALETVYQELYERCLELKVADKRRLAKVFLHYMYVDCDIGVKGA